MRMTKLLTLVVLLALLLVPAALFSQEQTPERGSIEFGVRQYWGDVTGRPDLPFTPPLSNSKFNEYRDIRNNFFVRRFNLNFDDILGSKNYVSLQGQRAVYKDQSYLATFGQYGRFKVQFRFDEIPHTYTPTARLLYTRSSPGVYTLPLELRNTLQAQSALATPARTLPIFMVTQVTCGIAIPPATQPPPCTQSFITPAITRKAGTALVSYNVTPDWNLNASFWREHQSGTRPIGLILNSSPSASATAGAGAELPEPIDYFNNTVKAGAEYGRKDWGVQFGYTGSFFENNINTLVFDNPFRVTSENGSNPLTGRMDLYPNNRAHYLNFAGGFDLTKYLRVMATVNPGWLRQNDPFVPYTSNGAINTCGDGTQPCSSLAVLPVSSLNGDKQTLAMNATVVTVPWKNLQFKAAYRHYDYNNNTPIHTFTPIEGDVLGGTPTPPPGEEDNLARATSFNKKTLELSGNWFFAKRSSVKVGWEGEWFDRSHRDAAHSFENSIFGTLDLSPSRDLLFRIALRHQDRKPDHYQDEAASDPLTDAEIACTDSSTTFTEEQRCHRRFDEAARTLDRADVMVQYNLQKFSFTGSFQTIQADYNRSASDSNGTNSPTPLNFLTGSAATTGPYFLYGALKDLSYIYSFDATYALSNEVSLFAEYTFEKYYKRMISRNRTPLTVAQLTAGTTILTCGVGAGTGSLGCDTANNDWESTYHDLYDTYAAGADFYVGKKVYLTTFYSLSAQRPVTSGGARGNVFSRALGDPGTATAPNTFTLTGSNAAQNYPEITNRIHELAAVFKYKLTKNLMPKLEYRYQRFDNKDYQTSAMTPYMGCIGTIAAPVNGCPSATANVGIPQISSFYPYFVVGDPSAARYLFMGVDQPSFHAHYIAATLEVHF